VGVGPVGVGVEKLKNEAEQPVSASTTMAMTILDFIFFPP
jgi:hypothetical protein